MNILSDKLKEVENILNEHNIEIATIQGLSREKFRKGSDDLEKTDLIVLNVVLYIPIENK